jgi:hypothetical protein
VKRKLIWPLALLTAVIGLAAGEARAAGAKELIAVLDLSPQGARPEEAVALTEQLRAELLKTGQFTLVDRSQMDSILEEQAFQQAGCTSQECAVQVGRILGIRKIVSGRVTKISDQLWQVSVLLLDVESAETLRAETAVHEGGLAPLLRAEIPKLAAQLAMVERPTAGPPQPQAAAPPPAPTALVQPPAVPATPTVPEQAAAVRTPALGAPPQVQTWREPITGIEFVYVPGGEYEQGCGAWNERLPG